ncbi:MAG: hypothetical protein QOH84_975 [Kribbellaceae bacterium]|nr:hypothetical protein [Kribbellaceae bacterium]
MKTFEDELLTELKTVVAERTPAAKSRGRRRVVVGLAAAVTLAAGTAIAVPLIGGDKTTAAAYSVTRTPEGGFQLTITGDDPAAVQRALEKTGVKAEVKYLKAGEYCRRTPAGQISPQHILTRYWFLMNAAEPDGAEVDPTRFRGWTLIIESSGQHGRVDPTEARIGMVLGLGTKNALSVDFVKTGTFGPCVVSR